MFYDFHFTAFTYVHLTIGNIEATGPNTQRTKSKEFSNSQSRRFSIEIRNKTAPGTRMAVKIPLAAKVPRVRG
jgi:hypothetical protein